MPLGIALRRSRTEIAGENVKTLGPSPRPSPGVPGRGRIALPLRILRTAARCTFTGFDGHRLYHGAGKCLSRRRAVTSCRDFSFPHPRPLSLGGAHGEGSRNFAELRGACSGLRHYIAFANCCSIQPVTLRAVGSDVRRIAIETAGTINTAKCPSIMYANRPKKAGPSTRAARRTCWV